MLQILINKAKCISCGVCIEACPARVLGISENGKPSVSFLNECIVCRNCQYLCPVDAIVVDLPGYQGTKYDKDFILA